MKIKNKTLQFPQEDVGKGRHASTEELMKLGTDTSSCMWCVLIMNNQSR